MLHSSGCIYGLKPAFNPPPTLTQHRSPFKALGIEQTSPPLLFCSNLAVPSSDALVSRIRNRKMFFGVFFALVLKAFQQFREVKCQRCVRLSRCDARRGRPHPPQKNNKKTDLLVSLSGHIAEIAARVHVQMSRFHSLSTSSVHEKGVQFMCT